MSGALIPPSQGGDGVEVDDRADVIMDRRVAKLVTGGGIDPPTKSVPIPPAHRCGEIRKRAARMMNFSAERAESHLRHQLRIKAETMRRRGIAEDEIARHGKSFESAVRAELWRCVFAPGESHWEPP